MNNFHGKNILPIFARRNISTNFENIGKTITGYLIVDRMMLKFVCDVIPVNLRVGITLFFSHPNTNK